MHQGIVRYFGQFARGKLAGREQKGGLAGGGELEGIAGPLENGAGAGAPVPRQFIAPGDTVEEFPAAGPLFPGDFRQLFTQGLGLGQPAALPGAALLREALPKPVHLVDGEVQRKLYGRDEGLEFFRGGFLLRGVFDGGAEETGKEIFVGLMDK